MSQTVSRLSVILAFRQLAFRLLGDSLPLSVDFRFRAEDFLPLSADLMPLSVDFSLPKEEFSLFMLETKNIR